MDDRNNNEGEEKQIIRIEAISDEDLETVDGGRYYGWGGGGWNTDYSMSSGYSDWSSNYYW